MNRVFNRNRGGYNIYLFLLFNTNVDTINSFSPNPSEELEDIIQAYISEVENRDIEHLVIPNITLQKTLDRIKNTNIILHPIDICLSKLLKTIGHKLYCLGYYIPCNRIISEVNLLNAT